jgi:tetratricopeptide (TPR) repeat protein
MRKLILLVFCCPLGLLAQDAEAVKQADNYIYDGNTAFDEANNSAAEKNYRRALALDKKGDIAKYNMATTLQQDNYTEEALRAYADVVTTTKERPKKHRSFHNIGNAMMQAKDYKRAVAAYKDALRNNPNDDETRYNYALAKKMLEDEEQNKDKQDNKDKQENQDDQDQNKDQNKEGDQDQDKEGEDKKDENKDTDDKDENEKDKKGADKDQDKENGKDKDKQPPKAQPTQLSPQQVQNLLEAMSNEEKKVQDKVNAKKVKAAGTKSKKDW